MLISIADMDEEFRVVQIEYSSVLDSASGIAVLSIETLASRAVFEAADGNCLPLLVALVTYRWREVLRIFSSYERTFSSKISQNRPRSALLGQVEIFAFQSESHQKQIAHGSSSLRSITDSPYALLPSISICFSFRELGNFLDLLISLFCRILGFIFVHVSCKFFANLHLNFVGSLHL